MLPKRRRVSESGRARWLITSIGIMRGASAGTGPMKCLRYVAEALLLDADVVVGEEGDERARGRGVQVRGRSVHARDETDEIAHEDEQPQRRDEREVRRPSGPITSSIIWMNCSSTTSTKFCVPACTSATLPARRKRDADEDEHHDPGIGHVVGHRRAGGDRGCSMAPSQLLPRGAQTLARPAPREHRQADDERDRMHHPGDEEHGAPRPRPPDGRRWSPASGSARARFGGQERARPAAEPPEIRRARAVAARDAERAGTPPSSRPGARGLPRAPTRRPSCAS